jgi:protein MpaA
MRHVMHGHRRTLAHSVQNRPIEGVFLCASEPKHLDTLFIGVFHGDEGISGAILKRFSENLQAGRLVGETIDWRRRPVLVVPVLNPDGLAVRNRRNANGADLNRNYPTGNWAEQGRGTPYDSGPAPGSEPETRLVIALIERYRPRKIITVHSPYRVLNFDGPARGLAEAMAAESGYAVVEDIGYPTPGSFGTYAGKERGIPVVTLELPPGPDDPPHEDQALPVEPVEQVWRDNAASLEAAIRFQS